MGDRSNVVIYTNGRSNPPVCLYSHWGGDMLATVGAALKRGRDRWSDGEYLARIVFCEMVGNDTRSTTGYGIGTACNGDLNNPVLVLDPDAQTATEHSCMNLDADGLPAGPALRSWTFAELAELVK